MTNKCSKCDKNATHKIENYFVVKSMKDKALYFCGEHAQEYQDLHPINTSPKRINLEAV